MSHVCKGATGVRVDASEDVHLVDLELEVANTGRRCFADALPGRSALAMAFTSALDGGHPLQGRQYGCMNADARGVAVAGSAKVTVARVRVTVAARCGFARAFDVFNHVRDMHFCGGNVGVNVTTLLDDDADVLLGNFTLGAKVGSAICLYVAGSSVTDVHGADGVRCEHVAAEAFDQAHFLSIGSDRELAAAAVRLGANAYTQ